MSSLSVELAIPQGLNPAGVTVRVAGTPDEPLFCLADVCAVLDIGNAGNVAARLDEDEKGIRLTDTPGGQQQMVFITEAGLYAVLLRSDKPLAKPFRKWVCGEVLPCIRRHGRYPAPADGPSEELVALSRIVGRLVEQEGQLRAVRARLDAQADELADARLLAGAALDCQRANYGYYTALAFLKLYGVGEVTLARAAALGVRATRICRARGVEIGKARDVRFGEVNTYPEGVLAEAWEQVNEGRPMD